MFNYLIDDNIFIGEILRSNVEGLLLLERGYKENEVRQILNEFKHYEHIEKEVAKMSLEEREAFYTWYCGQYKDDIITF